MIRLGPSLNRFVAAREGLAAVELAIIAPVLAICALCIGDLGRWALYRTWVTYAADAGAEYAAVHVTSLPLSSQNTTDITNAAKAAVPSSLVTVSATASGSYGCATASGVTTSGVTSTTICPSGTSTGGVAGRYVTVTATAPFSALFSGAGISYPSSVSASTMVRIQ